MREEEETDEKEQPIQENPGNGENSSTYSFSMKVPIERVAILIGKEGTTKNQIEDETGCKLDIDSKEGEVEIMSSDSLKLYVAKEIIKAIGRGFNPRIALLLLKQDYNLDVIELRSMMKSVNQMQRLKGRVIGEGGKSRKAIEGLTDTSISIYGKTIAIIGEASNVSTAKRAVESLLSGSPHHSVYTWLEKRKKQTREEEIVHGFSVPVREQDEPQ